eukprot:CAMPEP_0168619234 /NCGR_PEP_ID=MMETSP0449_2-20121227/6492_1 /TAXON_ID=1082188 /ORGANISM="Strombidium rassoulzadegani, Strain ras09" /LENGTH=68 /DNA_ID=CAMNT_0008660153 /DNA_START=211 /DNA_END=417 /DNA_ORIENTATION=-
MPNTDFEAQHEEIFKILREKESGEVTLDELSRFLNDLLKNQVKKLEVRMEQMKFERAMAHQHQEGMGK